MRTTMNPTLIATPKPKNPFTEISHCTPTSTLTRAKLLKGKVAPPFSLPAIHTVKCSNSRSDDNELGSLKDALSGMVDARVRELLSREENKDLLDGLEKAAARVDLAKREISQIKKLEEIEAKRSRVYVNHLESRADEIAECQREIVEARVMVEEAERSLDINGAGDKDGLTDMERKAINKDEERLESIKAASISAVVGTLAGLPISLTRVTSISQLILPLGITLVCCALFGVTFRYAVRRDLDNFQLKFGTSAAFGFVRGLATLEGKPPLELDADSLLSHAFDGALLLSENLLIFAFAAVGLDLCIKLRILTPFPTEIKFKD